MIFIASLYILFNLPLDMFVHYLISLSGGIPIPRIDDKDGIKHPTADFQCFLQLLVAQVKQLALVTLTVPSWTLSLDGQDDL